MVNYDFSHQITLAENAQQASRSWSDRARDFYNQSEDRAMQSILALDTKAEASPLFLPGLLVLLLALLFYLRGRSMIGYLVQRWSLRARRGGNLTAGLAALEYNEMLRLLERRGWKKTASQTPLEFAAAIPAAGLGWPRRPAHGVVSVRAFRQSSGARRPDVVTAATHPRLHPRAQAPARETFLGKLGEPLRPHKPFRFR